MSIKGVIFDLDGTLIDTIEDISDSMNMVLSHYGEETYSYEEMKLKVGRGFKNLVRDLCPGIDEEDYRTRLGMLEDNYRENYRKKSQPYKDIVRLLEELAQEGISLAINTNKNQDYSDSLVAQEFPQIDFVDVVGQREGLAPKPDPQGVQLIMEQMGLSKEELVYIGDSNVDMLTGREAGLKTIGVDWGFRGEEELRAYGADHIAYSPLDILDIIKSY